MYRMPPELERLLREAGAKSSEWATIRWICGHWQTPANYTRNIAELKRNGPELFHENKRR